MTRCRFRLLVPLLLAVVLAAGGGLAYAQGGATSTLSGTVLDTSGAVVPGATITAKDNATGAVFTAVSGANGAFTIPAMPPGTYTVTVELLGFKTAMLNDVILNVAVTSTVKAVLELGEIAETVIVQAATEIVQTQATAVAATMTARQIANLPRAGRGAFDLIGFMPGVVTNTGEPARRHDQRPAAEHGEHHARRHEHPGQLREDVGRHVHARQPAASTPSRKSPCPRPPRAPTWAARAPRRSGTSPAPGTNRYQGSAYFYYRRTWMNTNTWWNLNRNVDPVTGAPTPTARTFYDYPGARFGGPIIKDKAFFFVNYEEVRSPGTRTDTRTIMSPLSEQGMFQYSGGTVDLMALAAKNGQVATIDPTVAKLLADVRSSTSKGVGDHDARSADAVVHLAAADQEHHEVPDGPARLPADVEASRSRSRSTQNLLMSRPGYHEQPAGEVPRVPRTGAYRTPIGTPTRCRRGRC